jgi:hypothetical protein
MKKLKHIRLFEDFEDDIDTYGTGSPNYGKKNTEYGQIQKNQKKSTNIKDEDEDSIDTYGTGSPNYGKKNTEYGQIQKKK